MRRLGDLLPVAASALGLEEELRLARAMTAWERVVAEHAPAAAGATRLIAIRPEAIVVSASAPIVAQELRLRAADLLRAFATIAGGAVAPELRVVIRAGEPGPRGGSGARDV
jgi:hypothetical protein